MKEFEFVYVNDDGSVRELTILEKLFLRTKYHGADGARPYIKMKYNDKNGWGSLRGFCYRKRIPKDLQIEENQTTISQEQIINSVKWIEKMGYEINFSGIEKECKQTPEI